MKKYLFVVLAMLLVVTAVYAQDAYKYSGAKTADAIISNTPGRLSGLIIIADGTNACKVSLHDSLTNAGAKVVADFTVAAGEITGGVMFPIPIGFSTALFADVTVTGTCTFGVYYN